MRLAITTGRICVALSRRNLLALITKLDWPESRRALTLDTGDGVDLVVLAEDDTTHYGGRETPPGPMHPRTERDIQVIDGHLTSDQESQP